MSLLYLILAIFGLGFLVFIHELGHYWMALRCGMRVESFGIGFGKPIYSFMRHGVQWNICWLPFGGYVKIAGMETEDGKEPEQIEDGFFGKGPWARIKVAIMGPVANIVCALFFFFCIWISGGRDKTYAEVTAKIGWLDPKSELYQKGIRPGDIITSYDDEPFKGSKDHLHAAMTARETLNVKGLHWDKKKKSYIPFSLTIRPYSHPHALDTGLLTTGVVSPASFVFFPEKSFGLYNGLAKGSPLEGSGIEFGDRIVWINGQRVYTLGQLSSLVNDTKVLLTIKRDGKTLLKRIPKVQVADLQLTQEPTEELADWQYESGLQDVVLSDLYYIPYNLDAECRVEESIDLIDPDKHEALFAKIPFSEIEAPLQPGDQIVAVSGMQVDESHELLKALQSPKALIIVDRMKESVQGMPFEVSDTLFDNPVHSDALDEIARGIGTDTVLKQKGTLHLLNPVVPKTRREIFQSSQMQEALQKELEEEKLYIQAIDDPEKRTEALKFLEAREKQLYLGLPGVSDLHVQYNPGPFQMFSDVVDEVVRTLSALVGGYLSPKWISGPIGIVQVIHHQWMAGVKEALFWMAVISLNLGLLNLLPLPVLDGGYILMSLFELVTGVRLKAKTIERLVVPFAVLLIGFLIFLTYHDLIRLVSQIFRI